ncbi:MAG: hypothetical protein QXX95_07195 [Nitrososphaerales archaeon]
MTKIAEKVPGWVARFLLPEIRAIVKEEIKDCRIYVDDRFKAMDEKFISLRNEMTTRFESLEKRLGVLQRVAVLEAEVKELKLKLAGRTES